MELELREVVELLQTARRLLFVTGAVVRPDAVLYEETLPEGARERLEGEVNE